MRIWLAAALALALALSSPSTAHAAARFPRGPGGLPWPVVVGTSEGRFAVLSSGAVVRLSARPWRAPRPHVPRGWLFAGRGHDIFAHGRDGHIVISRNGQTLWSSHRRFRFGDRTKLWDFQWWSRGLAFRVRKGGPLFASWAGGPEVRLGPRLWAEGFTHNGFLLTLRVAGRPRTGTVGIWAPGGRRGGTLASGLSIHTLDTSMFDRRTGTFVYWSRSGNLVRADGVHREVLARLHDLGFSRVPETYVLRGGLIELFSRTWRGVVLRSDGSVFARASAPADGSVAGFGDQVANRFGDAVVYVLWDVQHPGGTVYLLRAGDRRGEALYHSRRAQGACDMPASWHDRWLLFAPYREDVAAIDTTGRSATIDLEKTVDALPGQTRLVRWAYPHPGPHLAAAR